jgi:hypothetical protein
MSKKSKNSENVKIVGFDGPPCDRCGLPDRNTRAQADYREGTGQAVLLQPLVHDGRHFYEGWYGAPKGTMTNGFVRPVTVTTGATGGDEKGQPGGKDRNKSAENGCQPQRKRRYNPNFFSQFSQKSFSPNGFLQRSPL